MTWGDPAGAPLWLRIIAIILACYAGSIWFMVLIKEWSVIPIALTAVVAVQAMQDEWWSTGK